MQFSTDLINPSVIVAFEAIAQFLNQGVNATAVFVSEGHPEIQGSFSHLPFSAENLSFSPVTFLDALPAFSVYLGVALGLLQHPIDF